MTTVAIGTVAIPSSHADLLSQAICGVLTTLGRDGQPHSSLVWVDTDGECARFNTTLDRQQGRNLIRDGRVSLLVVDPDDTSRYLQIRGDVQLVLTGAIEHLDGLTRMYTRHPAFYGYVYPLRRQGEETRVIGRIRAKRISIDAIHR